MGKIKLYHDKQPRERLQLPRCHWTKKGNSYKAKKPYQTEDEAWEYLKQRPWLMARGMTVYLCRECCKWHVGHKDVNKTDENKNRF